MNLELTLPPKVTPRAFARLAEINAGGPARPLRVAVVGGGCSGFQYDIRLDEAADDDLVLQRRRAGGGRGPGLGCPSSPVPPSTLPMS